MDMHEWSPLEQAFVDTERMRVPGGWLYRIGYDYDEDRDRFGSWDTVFVPAAAEPTLTEDEVKALDLAITDLKMLGDYHERAATIYHLRALRDRLTGGAPEARRGERPTAFGADEGRPS